MTSVGSTPGAAAASGGAPLDNVLVLDLTRMLPGAVLARQLIDLGARLIKVEDPAGGDPLRFTPPLHDGTSAVFSAFLRGAESICLDLAEPEDRQQLRRLSRHADVLIESFRPGTLASWGLAPGHLTATNPGLICCSLSAYGQGPREITVAHDLNLVAESGLLGLLATDGVPQVQLADVTTGLLAASAILAALLRRHRTGIGTIIDQPLLSGTLPHLTWPLADAAGGEGQSVLTTVLAGRCPAYQLYTCADGIRIAIAAIEPKLWSQLVKVLDLNEHAGDGLDCGAAGAAAATAVGRVLAGQPHQHWLAVAAEHSLPISRVAEPGQEQDAVSCLATAGLTGQVVLTGGATLTVPGPYLPSLGRAPRLPAPELGEQTDAVLRELAHEQ